MQYPDNDFEDFDFDDDPAGDSWDETEDVHLSFDDEDDVADSLAESEGGTSEQKRDKSRRRKIFPSLFLVLVAGASSAGLYYYFQSSETLHSDVPIVHINSPSLPADHSSLSSEQEQALQPLSAPVNNELNVVPRNDTEDHSDDAIMKNDTDNQEILTPLPEYTDNADINLPSLDVVVASSDIEEHIGEPASISVQRPDIPEIENEFLDEENLFQKTEVVPQVSQHEVPAATDTINNDSTDIGNSGHDDAEPTGVVDIVAESVSDAAAPEITSYSEENSAPLAHHSAEITEKEKSASFEKPNAEANKKKTARVAEIRKPDWKIKAAQNGKAVVRDSVSGETRSVEVGQNLPGLGRVIRIDKINGRWTIVGQHKKIMR